ncbi:multiple epidermal growth factor-like domains protein 8 [Centruroides vittatus]|uniref:multiple epidermal growth factor-like domains protein 8 n=1 Tax=Centruroides vittatus TaxID=120091 RepID=UPI00351039A1
MMTHLRLIWNLTLVVVFLLHTTICGQAKIAKSLSKDTCDKQRKILSGASGVFSDGSGNYPEDSHCEWLIKANNTHQYITLTFLEMETECSYDHVFVYNGDSYTSPLLGSFSGSTLPPPITANSGAMLILLYSDTNYIRKGFKAMFNITDCPLNCSQRGKCVGNICHCEQLWTGEACDISLCPNDCGINEETGECDRYMDPPKCICKPGYSGESCSLPESNLNGGNTWHLLTREKTDLSPRAGLAGVYLAHVDKFYLFGGFTFGSVLGDLLSYNFNESKWQKILTVFGPSPRWGHAIASYAKNFVLYGGELENGLLSDELWLYNVAKEEWQLEAKHSIIRPPALTKHSLTLVEGKWLYLFGGSLEDGSFSSGMYRINLNEGAQWEKIEPLGGKELERRIVGHSAVYHAATKSLFIYGGIMVDYARFSRLSNQIHAFHVDKQYWTQIAYPKSGTSIPLERAFHSAAVVGDYLVIYGGYTHRHSHQEICYDNEIYLYHLGCHKWVDFHVLGMKKPSLQNPIPQGVIAHAMGVRKGHTLLIAGGYSGMMKGSLLAYVMPPEVTIRGQQLPASACSSHRSKENCTAHPSCSWCSQNNQEFCLEKTMQRECRSGTFSANSCPGLCPTLQDCHSCLIWGEASGPNVIGSTDTMDPFLQPTCSWCVEVSQCHPIHNPPDTCRPIHNSSIPISELKWWGPTGTDITTIADCRTKDFRPGLISLKYRHPVNWKQPDGLSYINQTTEDLQIQTEFSREREGLSGGENIVRFSGFIHPLSARPLSENGSFLQMYMGFSGAKAILQMSNDSTEEHLEVIASNTSTSYVRIKAHRPDNRPLFPNTSPGHKYLINFTMSLPVAYNESATMQLVWNAFPVHPKVITVSHLEPYSNGSCHIHHNCLSCLSDAACGWCQQTSECVRRKLIDIHHPFYHRDNKHNYIITIPENCPVCSDYIYCEDCAKVDHCEWLIEEAHCGRRGRFEDAVRHQDLCPTPCHLRFNCTSCLGDPGRCAWCEETRSCFLFATYTTSFMFGRCREWVDEDRSAPSGVTTPGAQCRDCSRHADCKSCLKDLSCGWCGNTLNPTNGVCVQGDFSGPHSGECEALVTQVHPNVLSSESTDWFYSSCPDVEECWLGLHKCHPNATCTNTPDSYKCTCSHGFKGDGISTCMRTCSSECINGYCSEAPDYVCICKLGWTGHDCSINCGCNNHSNCTKGVALCDDCQDWTEGQFCERCKTGSFGNATTAVGCKKCNCNDHADESAGYCDRITGQCYCKDNTEGFNCERCKPGYYGDTRDGGHCYLECQPRAVITDIQKGLLGSQVGVTHPSHCLWILTVHPELDKNSFGKHAEINADIQLTIHADMKIKCPQNHLYIYDGLPEFISARYHGKLLGSYCSLNLSKPIVTVATSGHMTIYYKRTNPAHGFNATYQRLECGHSCKLLNKTCHGERCRCKNGFSGVTCNKEICKNKCSSQFGYGVCQQLYGTCLCKDGYGGSDCSVRLEHYHILWSTLFDSDKIRPSEYRLSKELPRMGHTLLASKKSEYSLSDLVWVFGGYSSIYGNLNDLYVYDTQTNIWIKVTKSPKSEGSPPERRFHCASLVDRNIYVFGGIGKEEVLGDFWKFSTLEKMWTKLNVPKELPALAGSTLTVVDDENLVLIGGFSPNYGFFEKTIKYNIKIKKWLIIDSVGAIPVGIYGHSSVYHSQTKSIFVFGGIIYNVKGATISSDLYTLHYPTGRWSKLPPNQPDSNPPPRSLHAAVLTDDYMLILGGRNEKFELVGETYVYIFKCNLWICLEKENVSVVGEPLPPVSGLSATSFSRSFYIFGGFNGETTDRLTKLTLPDDICHLFSNKQSECIRYTGCSYCSVMENNVSHTFCYSEYGSIPYNCDNPKGRLNIITDTDCNLEWMERRDCYQYKTCMDCVAVWPFFPNAKQLCKWCSNCQRGICIPASASCEVENDCKISQRAINQSSFCPIRECLASDCEKCGSLPNCTWTRQVERSGGEWKHTLKDKPIFNWTCVGKTIQGASSFPVESMPPLTCPPRCSQHRNCSTCLQSAGGEGGWHECRWSEGLQQCISPSFELLQCEGGACGAVLQGSSSYCPIPCWHHSQAAHCLSYPNCGWCAFSGKKVNGRGICMEGWIKHPTDGKCYENHAYLIDRPLPENVTKWLNQSDGPVYWAYLKQPPENECLNGHHNCDDKQHQECVDTEEKFECKCKQGYVNDGKQCKPVCNQGCMFGTCVEPNKCKCHFGYVGHNCSIQCDCNGHSNCAGPDRLNDCLKCHNNTQGSQCQKCKPFFVGNPTNGGKCIPCKVYCNGHSDLCFSSDFLNSSLLSSLSNHWDQYLMSEYLELVKEGPKDDAICINCQNNTENNRCDQCISGFFKIGDNIKEGCRPCECHGHGDMCNSINGENCNCQNNTENDRQCSQKNSKNMVTPCWQLQCSKCKEYFLGVPTNGHQCYRLMFLDKEYCFDPNTQEECNRKPSPLLPGRTVFFAVQPRYMNVDIRVIVDVTEGGADFYLSSKEDTFVVDVNKTTGIHYITFDRVSGIEVGTALEKNELHQTNLFIKDRKVGKREAPSDDINGDLANDSSPSPSPPLKLRESRAKGLTTYITITDAQEFLRVRNLQNRLVITIPQGVHDLRMTRFHMVIHGVGSKTSDVTYGGLFFRQDQTRIDLFVFFSVFFSCFFLFLAICVVIWKVKQAFDVRRARRLHAAEMKHMASRPFARIVAVIEEEIDDYDFYPYSPNNYRKKHKHKGHPGRDSPKVYGDDRYGTRPVAVEPVSDGIAALATVLVQLPGGLSAPVRLSLGTALITVRGLSSHGNMGIRAPRRRRTSHITL